MGNIGKITWGIVQGARAKALRLKKGFTLAYVADKIQYTKASLMNWESGKTRPSYKAVHDLAFLYNVSIQYLLEGIEECGMVAPDVENVEAIPVKADNLYATMPIQDTMVSTAFTKQEYSVTVSQSTFELIQIMAKLSTLPAGKIIDKAMQELAHSFDWAGAVDIFMSETEDERTPA